VVLFAQESPGTTISDVSSIATLLQEDARLTEILKNNPTWNSDNDTLIHGMWTDIANNLGTGRTPKQCRDRWQNYLRPGIKKGGWSVEEEELIKDMYSTFGPR